MIKAKLVIVDENIKLVRDNLPLKLQDFKELGLVKDGIYNRIEASIQEVLSVCSIINADLKLGIPSNREDIIDALTNEKVISNELANKIKGLKGFRNFLEHRYGKLNDERTFEDITKGLSDFSKFKEEILNFIKNFEEQEKLQKDGKINE